MRKQIRTVVIECSECEVSFNKREANVKQRQKEGGKLFCSRTCIAVYYNRQKGFLERPEEHRSVYWNPFYYIVRQAVKNSLLKKHSCGISAADIEKLYRKQEGKCALSGVTLLLPKSRADFSKVPERISLDRIDSSQDYKVGNIQLITCMANYCKHTWSNEDVIEFAKNVVNKNT